MPRRRPDIGKIQRATGWTPGRSLEEAVADVVSYERDTRVGGAVLAR
jgi:nucleoside-diphosphate-sugar epimerase